MVSNADSDRVSGTERLRTSGFGVVLGGVTLGFLSLFAAYTTAAVAVAALGVAAWLSERSRGTRLSIGVAVVGAIGVVESSTRFGLGLEPLALASVAVVFGVFDVVAGWILGRRTER